MSSRKVPEVIFTATAGTDLLWDNREDLSKYLTEHAGEKLFVHVEPIAQLSDKMRLFAFYHKVMLPCTVIGYTYLGYEGIDNVTADFKLRAEFAKDFIKNPNGEWEPIILDKRNMTKARLHKYMSDCAFFIENTLQQRIPDSEEYKIFKETGIKFKTVK